MQIWSQWQWPELDLQIWSQWQWPSWIIFNLRSNLNTKSCTSGINCTFKSQLYFIVVSMPAGAPPLSSGRTSVVTTRSVRRQRWMPAGDWGRPSTTLSTRQLTTYRPRKLPPSMPTGNACTKWRGPLRSSSGRNKMCVCFPCVFEIYCGNF